MKNLYNKMWLFMAVCLVAGSFSACGDDGKEGEKPLTGTITADTEALSFTCGDYYALRIGVKAVDVEWNASADADWVHVAPTYTLGTQDGEVLVTVDKNTGDARSAVITLSGKNAEPVQIPVSQEKAFKSALAGTYKPSLKEYEALDQPAGDLFIDATWTTGMGPKIPVAIPGLFPDGVDWMMLDYMLIPIMGSLYSQGLDSFTFRDDGTLAATYHAMSGGFMNPDFAPEISEFPTEETMKVLPPQALRYYTQEDKVFFSIDKAYLNKVAAEQFGVDNVCSVIDLMVGQYEGLSLVSTDAYFALPFKYKDEAGVLTLYVDREMMLPYKPLLKTIVPLLLGAVDAETLAGFGLDPNNPEPILEFIETLFSTSEKLDIGLRLAKQ